MLYEHCGFKIKNVTQASMGFEFTFNSEAEKTLFMDDFIPKMQDGNCPIKNVSIDLSEPTLMLEVDSNNADLNKELRIAIAFFENHGLPYDFSSLLISLMTMPGPDLTITPSYHAAQEQVASWSDSQPSSSVDPKNTTKCCVM